MLKELAPKAVMPPSPKSTACKKSTRVMDKSPAKFITSTKVIKRDGSKPTFKDYAVRSLVRVFLIEALSFVTTKNAGNPIGWHDSTAGTLVVDDPPKHWNK